MRDLLTDPAWSPEDLGQPLPDSPHAVSVAMPLWRHVVGYEEEDPDVIDRLRCGYPRFFFHPFTRRLFAMAHELHGRPGEVSIVFPTAGAAVRAAEYGARAPRRRDRLRIVPLGAGDLHVVTGPEAARPALLEYWRYSGEIVSSRVAERVVAELAGERTVDPTEATGNPPSDGPAVRTELKRRLAGHSGQDPGDVFLFGSGMQATFAVHRMFDALRPRGDSLQLDFPYVDVLKVQREFGHGSVFLPHVDAEAWEVVERGLSKGRFSCVFCELASNPLMRTADVERLSRHCRSVEVPVCIDDTVATVHNADVFPFADVVTTSLTKFFGGRGDVMAGAVVVNRTSPFAGEFRTWLQAAEAEGAALHDADAAALLEGACDFDSRMETVNRNTEALVDLFKGHPAVERVHYPGTDPEDRFDLVRRPGRGRSGLVSIVLRDAERQAPGFHDRLRVSKGPSFGARFTLACPYTLLAHYRELDWAESCGVSRWLVRIGVGVEHEGDLLDRFGRALDACR